MKPSDILLIHLLRTESHLTVDTHCKTPICIVARCRFHSQPMSFVSIQMMVLWYYSMLHHLVRSSSNVKLFHECLTPLFLDDMYFLYLRHSANALVKKRRKLLRGVFWWYPHHQSFHPLPPHTHTRDAHARIRPQHIKYKRWSANSFTNVPATSCDLVTLCWTNRCDAGDARAEAGLPLSPNRLRKDVLFRTPVI